MIKYLRIACILFLIVFVLLVNYGRDKFTNINFNIEDTSLQYSLLQYEDFLMTSPEVVEILVDDKKVNSLGVIIDQSEFVLKVKTVGKTVRGMGIINECEVLETYKGSQKFEKDRIFIYDYTDRLFSEFVTYVEGTKPMNLNKEYIVFLKSAPRPNMDNTYIYASINFGSFPINKTDNYLDNYESGTKSLKDTYNYDYICKDKNFLETYKLISKELDLADFY